jgi:hypothetical protein
MHQHSGNTHFHSISSSFCPLISIFTLLVFLIIALGSNSIANASPLRVVMIGSNANNGTRQMARFVQRTAIKKGFAVNVEKSDSVRGENGVLSVSNATELTRRHQAHGVFVVSAKKVHGRWKAVMFIVDGRTAKKLGSIRSKFWNAPGRNSRVKLSRLLARVQKQWVNLPPILEKREEDPTETKTDKYSTMYEKPLLLSLPTEMTVPFVIAKKVEFLMGLKRFDRSIHVNDPNTPTVTKWCHKVASRTQRRRKITTGVGTNAILSKAVIEQRCVLYQNGLEISHKCKRKSTKKGNAYLDCKIKATARFRKYKPSLFGKGQIKYEIDSRFSKDWLVLTGTGTGTASLKKTRLRAAKLSALSEAALIAGMKLRRKLRGIKDFQLRAPIKLIKRLTAYTCLGKDVLELDQPFHIIYNGPNGEVRAGWMKARRMWDGCYADSVATKGVKGKKKIILRESEYQIILGGHRVKAGMIAWEMPSIGLDIGGFGGMTGTAGFYEGNVGFGGGMSAAFNLAPFIGISELYIFSNNMFAATVKPQAVRDIFEKAFEPEIPNISSYWKDQAALFAFQTDLGVLKRQFIAGPLFAEAAIAFSLSVYNLALDVDDVSASLSGYGIALTGGVGWQLAPRWTTRINIGYRVLALRASVTVESTDKTYSKWAGFEHGFMTQFFLMYTW